MLATLSRYAVIILAVLLTLATVPGDAYSAEVVVAIPVLVQEAQEDPDKERPKTIEEILKAARELPCQWSVHCRLSSYKPSWAQRATDRFQLPEGADRRVYPFPNDRQEGVAWNFSPDGGTVEGKFGGVNFKVEASGLAVPGTPKKGSAMAGGAILKNLKAYGGLSVAEGEKPRPKIGVQSEGRHHLLSVDIDPLNPFGGSTVTGSYRPSEDLSVGLGLGPHGWLLVGDYRS